MRVKYSAMFEMSRLPTRLSDFGPPKDIERGPLEGWDCPPCTYCGSPDHETGAAECQRELIHGEDDDIA